MIEFSLSTAEMFLIFWAVSASCFAVRFQFELKKASFLLVTLSMTVRNIAEEKARVKMVNGQVQIEPILPLSKNER